MREYQNHYGLPHEVYVKILRVLETESTCLGKDYRQSIQKKKLDRLVGFFGTSISMPLIAFSTACIFAYDREPPLIRLPNTNPINGDCEGVLKVRTMVPHAHQFEDQIYRENGGKKPTSDPRILPMATLLRMFSLDELPQFLQIYAGQFSLVGYRPYSNVHWDEIIQRAYEDRIHQRFIAEKSAGYKPGIIGLYTVMGRGNLDLDTRVRMDMMYADLASLKGDLRIIGLTTIAALRCIGAY